MTIKKPGHPTISVVIWHLDGTRMAPKRNRKVFRAYSNPNYGVLRDGREVQYLQIGMTNKHKWYLKGSAFNNDGTWK